MLGDILIDAFGANYDEEKGALRRTWTPWTEDLESEDEDVFGLFTQLMEADINMELIPDEAAIAKAGKLKHQIAYQALYKLIGADLNQDGIVDSAELLQAWQGVSGQGNEAIGYENWRYLVFMPAGRPKARRNPNWGRSLPSAAVPRQPIVPIRSRQASSGPATASYSYEGGIPSELRRPPPFFIERAIRAAVRVGTAPDRWQLPGQPQGCR